MGAERYEQQHRFGRATQEDGHGCPSRAALQYGPREAEVCVLTRAICKLAGFKSLVTQGRPSVSPSKTKHHHLHPYRSMPASPPSLGTSHHRYALLALLISCLVNSQASVSLVFSCVTPDEEVSSASCCSVGMTTPQIDNMFRKKFSSDQYDISAISGMNEVSRTPA